MAAYTGKAVVTSAKITFAGAAYDCKSIPSGIPETCEPPNVTVLTDTEQRFESAAVTEDGEIQAVVAGSHPALNAVGSLTIALTVSVDGETAADSNVSVGNCIVTGVEPANIEAGGDRVLTWTVTFKPNGSRS